MPNVMNQELVRAFNIILCHNEVAITNLTMQSTDQTFFKKEDCIVTSFDKNMDVGQCMEYLHNIKESIVETFCGSESGANISFNTKFFPFNFNESQLTKYKEGYKFLVPIDKGVVFNLKCLLAHGLAKDAKEDMGNEFGERCMEGRVYDVSFDRKSYLYCMQFYDKRLQDYFVESFSSRVKNYKNGPKRTDDFLKIKGNCMYIKKSIFNNAEFIKDIVKHKASLECRDFEVTSAEDETVESLKFPVIDLSRKVGVPINSVLHVSYTGSDENSVLIPATKEVIGNIIYYKILGKEQADDINKVFGMTVLNNVEDCISPKHLPVSGNGGVYGIDFYDKDISYCVLNKIMESSVINKDHELSIDPELHFRALSPAQSPVRVPNGPSSYFTESLSPIQGFPSRNQDGALKDSPRQESEKFFVLLPLNPLDVPGTSREFPPRSHLSFTTVNYGVAGPSSLSQSVSAAQNVPAGSSALSSPPPLIPSSGGIVPRFQPPVSFTSTRGPGSSPPPLIPSSCVSAAQNVQASTNARAQPMDSRLSQGTSENKWQPLQFTEPGFSGSLWTQSSSELSSSSSPAPSAGLWPLPKSGPSSSERPDSTRSTDSDYYSESSRPSQFISKDNTQPIDYSPSQGTLREQEKLTEALLYTLNLMNYILDGVYTNFFAKDGKIVSLLHDNVDREKYLQAVTDYIIEEYCEDKEKARKLYDLDEFPFKLNCEEKQGKTVVANISSGALSNLKILFSQKFGKNVDAIDISAVKKVEKREKDKWVDCQSSEGCSFEDACISCFPDEGVMKIIPIAFQGDKYVLDRSCATREVKLLLKEQLRRFRGKPLEKLKSSDKPLTEEEKNLFKELLYAFNLNNYIFEYSNTNFIVKDGKIASLIHDSVNVEEYLQEVIDKTKKEYLVDKKEAYDLNEFPFKFLSNCEKNQETTVVANISRGALLNLKELFIYGHEKKVKIGDIDIKIVKKAVESKRCKFVNSDVKKIEEKGGNRVTPHELITTCYPDESALEDVPIRKYKSGCCLDRNYSTEEVKSFLKERRCVKGTRRNATTTFKKIEESKKDDSSSGYSSGFVTDAEKVNPNDEPMDYQASSHVQQQNPWSDDEGNSSESSRSGSSNSSSKRALELSVENLRISTKLDATKTEQWCSPVKKSRSN